MPYTYQGWTLYSRDVKLKKGPKVTIYFFSKRKPKSGKPMDEMPPSRPHTPRQLGGGPRPFPSFVHVCPSTKTVSAESVLDP